MPTPDDQEPTPMVLRYHSANPIPAPAWEWRDGAFNVALLPPRRIWLLIPSGTALAVLTLASGLLSLLVLVEFRKRSGYDIPPISLLTLWFLAGLLWLRFLLRTIGLASKPLLPTTLRVADRMRHVAAPYPGGRPIKRVWPCANIADLRLRLISESMDSWTLHLLIETHSGELDSIAIYTQQPRVAERLENDLRQAAGLAL